MGAQSRGHPILEGQGRAATGLLQGQRTETHSAGHCFTATGAGAGAGARGDTQGAAGREPEAPHTVEGGGVRGPRSQRPGLQDRTLTVTGHWQPNCSPSPSPLVKFQRSNVVGSLGNLPPPRAHLINVTRHLAPWHSGRAFQGVGSRPAAGTRPGIFQPPRPSPLDRNEAQGCFLLTK